MRALPFVCLAMVLLPLVAEADCVATCTRNANLCGQRCSTNAKCYRTCEQQSDTCMSGCQSRGDLNAPETVNHGKCVGPKGKMVACSELVKTVTPAQVAKGQAQAKARAAGEDKKRKPTPEQMEQMREYGVIR